jgi:hypothetical protein
MKNLKLLINYYSSLSKKGKILFILGGLVGAILLIELLK